MLSMMYLVFDPWRPQNISLLWEDESFLCNIVLISRALQIHPFINWLQQKTITHICNAYIYVILQFWTLMVELLWIRACCYQLIRWRTSNKHPRSYWRERFPLVSSISTRFSANPQFGNHNVYFSQRPLRVIWSKAPDLLRTRRALF